MKIFTILILVCLLITGPVSAKALDSVELGVTRVSPGTGTGIYTPVWTTGCSDDSASVGTPVEMGELDVDSIPDGASVMIDGSPWTYSHCIGGWPNPVCFASPIRTPYTGRVDTGTHSITITLGGYKSYTGSVTICSQKVSYVHKELAAMPATATTMPATTVTTTAATTTATAAATTTAPSAATTTSPPATSAAAPAATTAAVPAITPEVSGMVIPSVTGVPGTTAAAISPADAAPPAAAANTRSPGFGGIAGIAALGAILCLRAVSRR